MVLTVFGATGQVGKRVVQQALALEHTVRAFGRNTEMLIDRSVHQPALIALKGYVFEESDVLDAIKGADAVVSVLGGAFDGTDKTRSLGIKNIIMQMQHAGVQRIAALGGLGVLNAPDDTLLIDQPGYPEAYKPVGLEHLAAYQLLEASSLKWTFICAPNILDTDGNRQYITSAHYPPNPNQGEIAAGDLAHCLIDCATTEHYIGVRVGISRL